MGPRGTTTAPGTAGVGGNRVVEQSAATASRRRVLGTVGSGSGSRGGAPPGREFPRGSGRDRGGAAGRLRADDLTVGRPNSLMTGQAGQGQKVPSNRSGGALGRGIGPQAPFSGVGGGGLDGRARNLGHVEPSLRRPARRDVRRTTAFGLPRNEGSSAGPGGGRIESRDSRFETGDSGSSRTRAPPTSLRSKGSLQYARPSSFFRQFRYARFRTR